MKVRMSSEPYFEFIQWIRRLQLNSIHVLFRPNNWTFIIQNISALWIVSPHLSFLGSIKNAEEDLELEKGCGELKNKGMALH